MKRLILAVSIAAVALMLTESAKAQRGHGAGSPAGPPAMSQRDQMPDRSGKPGKESGLSGNREQGQSNLTVSDKLAKNTHLAANLQGLFPPGTDLQAASSGFKNLGQFCAAAHVSKNLGIPFDQLKAKMTGISSASPNSTGASPASPVSLGKAIQQLRPQADAKSEVKKAELQAKEDIKGADSARKEEEKKTEQSGT